MSNEELLILSKVMNAGGGGGGDITVESLSVTENGTYTAPSGKAYSPVNVNVPQPSGLKLITNTDVTDVSSYAQAKVSDSNLIAENIKKNISILGIVGTLEQAVPIEVTDPSQMTDLLVSSNVGKVYLYNGTTTSDYTKGDLYVVEQDGT